MKNYLLFSFIFISYFAFANAFKDAENMRRIGNYHGAINILKNTFENSDSAFEKTLSAYHLIMIFSEIGELSECIPFSDYLVKNGDFFQKKTAIDTLYKVYLSLNNIQKAEKYLKMGLRFYPDFKLYAYYFYNNLKREDEAIAYLEDYFLVSHDHEVIDILINEYKKKGILSKKIIFWRKKRLNYREIYIQMLYWNNKDKILDFLSELSSISKLDKAISSELINFLISNKDKKTFENIIKFLKEKFPFDSIEWEFKGKYYLYGKNKALEWIENILKEKAEQEKNNIAYMISKFLASQSEYLQAYELVMKYAKKNNYNMEKVKYLAETRDLKRFLDYLQEKGEDFFYTNLDLYFNRFPKSELIRQKERIFSFIEKEDIYKKVHICILFQDWKRLNDILRQSNGFDALTEKELFSLDIYKRRDLFEKFGDKFSEKTRIGMLSEFGKYYFVNKEFDKSRKYLIELKKYDKSEWVNAKLLFIKMSKNGIAKSDSKEVMIFYPEIYYFYNNEYNKAIECSNNIDENRKIIHIASEIISKDTMETSDMINLFQERKYNYGDYLLFTYLIHEKVNNKKIDKKKIRTFIFGFLGLIKDYSLEKEKLESFEYGDMLLNKEVNLTDKDISDEDKFFLYYLNKNGPLTKSILDSIKITDNYFLRLIFKSEK